MAAFASENVLSQEEAKTAYLALKTTLKNDVQKGTHKLVLTKENDAYLFYFFLNGVRGDNDVLFRVKNGDVKVTLHSSSMPQLPMPIKVLLTNFGIKLPSLPTTLNAENVTVRTLTYDYQTGRDVVNTVRETVQVNVLKTRNLGYPMHLSLDGILYVCGKKSVTEKLRLQHSDFNHVHNYMTYIFNNLLALNAGFRIVICDLKLTNLVSDFNKLNLVDIDHDTVLNYNDKEKEEIKSTYWYRPTFMMRKMKQISYPMMLEGFTQRFCAGRSYYDARFVEAQQQMFGEILITLIQLDLADFRATESGKITRRHNPFFSTDVLLNVFCKDDEGKRYALNVLQHLLVVGPNKEAKNKIGEFNWHYLEVLYLYQLLTGQPKMDIESNKEWEGRDVGWWLKDELEKDSRYGFVLLTPKVMKSINDEYVRVSKLHGIQNNAQQSAPREAENFKNKVELIF